MAAVMAGTMAATAAADWAACRACLVAPPISSPLINRSIRSRRCFSFLWSNGIFSRSVLLASERSTTVRGSTCRVEVNIALRRRSMSFRAGDWPYLILLALR